MRSRSPRSCGTGRRRCGRSPHGSPARPAISTPDEARLKAIWARCPEIDAAVKHVAGVARMITGCTTTTQPGSRHLNQNQITWPFTDAATARPRLARVNTLLAAAGEPGSVTVGLAELHAQDTRRDLIARADTDLDRNGHTARRHDARPWRGRYR